MHYVCSALCFMSCRGRQQTRIWYMEGRRGQRSQLISFSAASLESHLRQRGSAQSMLSGLHPILDYVFSFCITTLHFLNKLFVSIGNLHSVFLPSHNALSHDTRSGLQSITGRIVYMCTYCICTLYRDI